ncbi:general stress protein [Antribacter gilvus]|uniref:general stress protein n=1 Tax=Antribacter gilvus TaxID=2304675 RepID=UPI001F0C4957|nr:general stress protein [Antribacter gilvus]
MSMSRPGAVPKVPTLPRGDEVAAFPTYLEAQQAVDHLSDNKFPVENVTIVGTDLRMVERVTGRLTYGRVALAGALSGAWFGFFVGLLLTFFAGSAANGVLFVGIALGAGFGLLFSVLSYAFTGGRRDFTSSSQIVAASYAILCAPEMATDARTLLAQSPGGLGVRRPGGSAWGTPPAGPPAAGPPAGPVGGPAAGPAAGQWGGAGPDRGAGATPGAGETSGGESAEPGTQPGPAEPAEPAPPRTPDPRWTTPTGEPRYGAMRPPEDQKPDA